MGKGFVGRLVVSALLGFGALVLVMVGFIVTQNHQDSRPMVVLTYVAFFVAALLSPGGDARLNWTGGLAVAVGGIGPALALNYFGVALTDHVFLGFFLAAALVAVATAVAARSLGARGRRGQAAALSGAALLAAVGAGFWGAPAVVDHFAFVDANRAVGPFALRTLDGRTIRSDAWRGRVVVLSYWATWCTPCLAEMPKIAALQRQYQADPRVLILAVNSGSSGDTAEKARAFLQRRGFDGAVAIDDVKRVGEKWGDAGRTLGLKVVPTLFILDRTGNLSAVHTGYDEAEPLAKSVSARIARLGG